MDWISLIERVGFPTTLCIALILGIWRAGKWLGYAVVVPIANAHLSLVKTVEDSTIKNTAAISALVDGQKEMSTSFPAAITNQTAELKECFRSSSTNGAIRVHEVEGDNNGLRQNAV